MANNQVEIDVVLTGAEEVTEAFDSIGETSAAMAERFSKDNSKLGEGLGSLTGNVQEMVGSVKGLGQAFKMSGTSMLGMVPAIGAVVAAGFALYETFLNISGAAEEAERAEQAMAAAASDLQGKLEALAEKGVIPTADELQRFTEATIQSQYAKEQLQVSMERKVTPAMESYNELLREQRELQKLINKDTGVSGAVYLEATKRLPELDKELAKARAKLTSKLGEYREEQIQVEKDIKAAAKQEEEFAERSTEARLAKIKENKTILDAIELMKAQITQTEAQAKITESLIKQRRQLFDLTLEQAKEDDNEDFIKDLNDKLKRQLAGSNREKVIVDRGVKERQDLRKQEREKEKAEQEKERARRQAHAQAMRSKRLAEERQLQSELARIRQLGYEQLRLEGVDALEILEMQYQDELKAAGDNQNLKLIAEMKYQNAIARIENERTEKVKDELNARRQAEQDSLNLRFERAKSFAFETAEFDARQIEDQTARELALLDLRYQKEISLNEHTQEEITELQRRQSIERQKIQDQTVNAQIEKFSEFTKEFGSGLAQATYNSLLFGESFKESIGNILIGIGQQASVEAIMELARGFSKLGSPLTAGLAPAHFKASALFAGAATAAGVAGKALGGGGGSSAGGGGGAGPVSPSGTPQTTEAPQREQAETSQMVFNINFGGAVIYDTQRAAEQALADRITNLQNTRRRGAPRRGAM
jgi:hypothetical protein